MEQVLDRTTFTTSRLLEFFTEPELSMQIGHDRHLWAAAILKELIDNGLDDCEKIGVAPHIQVTIEDNALVVEDNGSGLPADTLERSLNYDVRVSDKSHYVSPTRGQLGNALKCVWAAPFVVDGRHGRVEVASRGVLHCVDVTLDAIEQQPKIAWARESSAVKTGTFFRLPWPGVASCLDEKNTDSYNASQLLRAYATLNPHATFTSQVGGEARTLRATDCRWQKWRPDWPTSPHWYTPEVFRSLIAAYLADERRRGQARTVREFVAEFDGLSGSQKQKRVLQQAGLSGARLKELVNGGEVDAAAADRLLQCLQQNTRLVQPSRLGLLGEEHLKAALTEHFGAIRGQVHYKRKSGIESGVPFVVEVAFGMKRAFDEPRDLVVGLNWSPALMQPLPQLETLLADVRVDPLDPVAAVVHLVQARLEPTDRGKGRYWLRGSALAALEKCVRLATKDWQNAADGQDFLPQRLRFSKPALVGRRSDRPPSVGRRGRASRPMQRPAPGRTAGARKVGRRR